MSEFGILGTAAAGMDAQRFALDVAARNVAAAQVTDPAHPFARLVPQFAFGDAAEGDSAEAGDEGMTAESSDDARPEDVGEDPASDAGGGDGEIAGWTAPADAPAIRAVGTRTLRGVDVDTVTEMVAVLNAQRAYEANASVFDAGKRLAERTIDVGRL